MTSKNKIGAALATAVGLGAIIGAGIYVLSGTAVALAGADALIAFLIVGVVAFIIALELGELGSLMPHVKGASYSYTYKAFGSELGFITGMMRYLALSTSISAVSLGFGAYLSSLLGFAGGAYSITFAIFLIVILSVVNILGVKKAAEADLALVAIKIAILLLFVGFVLFAFAKPDSGLQSLSFNISGGALGGIFAASVVVFFAYTGFQSISSLTNDMKGGSKDYVKAILSAVAISFVLYVLVVLGLLLLLPQSAYKISADPLAYALKSSAAPSWLIVLIDLGALVATASAAIAMILSSSRSLYQMSRDHILPRFLMEYNKKNDTAGNGIIVSAAVGIAMLFSGNIYVIASIANFGLMFDYLIIGFDVMHFRRSGKRSSFMMPMYPYLPAIATVMLLVFFTGMPTEALLIGVVLIILLLVAYYSLREIREKKIIRVRLFD